jgi:hypothetical protein
MPVQPPLWKDSKSLAPPRFCRLGEDCMALDSHPFELCHVSSKSCGDKLVEVLLVQKPKSETQPGLPLVKTAR